MAEYIHTQKYVRTSPRKLRDVVFAVKKMRPEEAVLALPHLGKRAAQPVSKAIKTAIANTIDRGANAKDLVFKEIQVSEGPRLKRYRAGSRGAAKPYVKRMSHIRIILEEKKPEVPVKQTKAVSTKTNKKATVKKEKKGGKKASK